jgi:hypothetical protein
MAESPPWLRVHGGYTINPITLAEASDALRSVGLPPAAEIHGAISALHRFEVRGGMFQGMQDSLKRTCIAQRARIRREFENKPRSLRRKYNNDWSQTPEAKKFMEKCGTLQMAGDLVKKPLGAVTNAYFKIMYWLIYSHVILNAFGGVVRLMYHLYKLGDCMYDEIMNYDREDFDPMRCIEKFKELPDVVRNVIDLNKSEKILISPLQIICSVIQETFGLSDEIDYGGKMITDMLRVYYGPDSENEAAFKGFEEAYDRKEPGQTYSTYTSYILAPIKYLLGCDTLGDLTLQELVKMNEYELRTVEHREELFNQELEDMGQRGPPTWAQNVENEKDEM